MIRGLTKNSIVLGLGALLAFLGIQAYNWYHPPKRGIAYRVAPTRPYEAPRSRLEARLSEVRSEVAQKAVRVLKPTVAETRKIEDKLDGKLPVGPILGIRDIKPLPHGGRAVVSLEPDATTGAEKAVLTIYPKKPSFFEWTLDRSVGVWSGTGFGNLAGQVWNVEFEQGLFRLGPAELSARAGLFSSPVATDGYVMVGAKVRF